MSGHIDKVGIDQINLIHFPFEEFIHCHAANCRNVSKGGCSRQIGELGDDLLATPQEHIASFAPDSNIPDGNLEMVKMLDYETDDIGIVCARQAPVATDRHYEYMMDLGTARQKRVQDRPSGLLGNVHQHLPCLGSIRARRGDGRHCLANFAGTDGLQGTRHLRDTLDTADSHPHFTG